MPKTKPSLVAHDHAAFLARARSRDGFSEAYEALTFEYRIIRQLLEARTRAGLTQEVVAERMGTTKSAVSRLEGASKHVPSLSTLRRYAHAVGCEIDIRLVARK